MNVNNVLNLLRNGNESEIEDFEDELENQSPTQNVEKNVIEDLNDGDDFFIIKDKDKKKIKF